MNNGFQFMPISQLAERFPEDSWWAKFYKDFSNDDIAAVYEGDLSHPFLDLDWGKPFTEQENTITIFIGGNFTVDNLYNAGTDGAIGLTVMGNLTAKNIAVGGQEIYVHGHLKVEGILSGSYNHGETIVKGNLHATVLVQDDEYRFKVDGQKRLKCLVNIWYGDGVFQDLPVKIQDVLIEEVFLNMDDDDEDDEIGFSFDTLVRILKEGRSPLTNLNEIYQTKKTAPLYFTHNNIDEENIWKLTQCILMSEDTSTFNFEEQGVHFTVQREQIDEDGDKSNDNVYLKTSQYHYFIWLNEDQSISLLRKTLDEGAEWMAIMEISQDDLSDLKAYWILLLTSVNVAELYLRDTEIQYVKDILQHPEIQALDDDNDGFWDDSKYYSFRQSYIDEEGDFIHARVEIMTPDETYYFYTLDNQSYVSRYYQPPNYYGSLDISFLDARRWEASEQYFEGFKQFMSKKVANQPRN